VAVDILRLSDYPTEGLRPKHWREFAGEDAPAFDFVFTLCDLDAGEPPPHWPGRPVTADWRYPDPEKLSGEDWVKRKALSEILAGLERQFAAFAQLPFESLNEMSLRTQLEMLHRSQEK
jgi:arsenate reductase (thioredoxin)